MSESRLTAAREARHGLRIVSFEQAAARRAGGFVRPIDDESLRAVIQDIPPATPMGEMGSIKALPGMVDAVADTVQKLGAPASILPHALSIKRLRRWSTSWSEACRNRVCGV